MDLKEQLKTAGFTENEAKVYQALLEIGQKTASTVSSRTGLHRRVVYDTLQRLIKKGLVGYIIENNKKVFQAANPSRILEVIKEKEETISKIMPEMIQLFNQDKEKPRSETNFYKGTNGLKAIFEDQL